MLTFHTRIFILRFVLVFGGIFFYLSPSREQLRMMDGLVGLDPVKMTGSQGNFRFSAGKVFLICL